jgi:hypothetical protein
MIFRNAATQRLNKLPFINMEIRRHINGGFVHVKFTLHSLIKKNISSSIRLMYVVIRVTPMNIIVLC